MLPLDGGHIVMAILEKIRGRSFSQLAYLRYSAVGLSLFALLLLPGPAQRPLLRRELYTRDYDRPWGASVPFASAK